MQVHIVEEMMDRRAWPKNARSLDITKANYYELHQRALDLSQRYHEVELQLVEVLKKIDSNKIHKVFGFPTLFQYAVGALGLSEGVAYSFISVARKSREIESLNNALSQKKINVSKASRIVSALSNENSETLIEFAEKHSYREIDLEVSRINPKSRTPDRAKPLSPDTFEVKMAVSEATFKKLKRAQSVLSSKKGKHVSFESVLDEALNEMLKRQDPLEKAKRSQAKTAYVKTARLTPTVGRDQDSADSEKFNSALSFENPAGNPAYFCAHRKSKRKPLTAAQKHAVYSRDGGRCAHVDRNGVRCNSDRWLHTHHIIHVSSGGTNDPENLTTLCSYHHDLAHQLTLPLEGEVTWLRSPRVAYG